MRLQWLNKGVFIVVFLSVFSIKAPLTEKGGSLVVPSVPYPTRFKPLPTVPSYPTDSRFAVVQRPVWSDSYGYGAASQYYSPYATDADSTAGVKTSLDGDETDDAETSIGSDFAVQQKGRNDMAQLEAMYSSLTPNDFVGSPALESLIDTFESQVISTKVHLVMLLQAFLVDFVRNDGWSLGDQFKRKVFTHVDKLTGKLSGDQWKVVDEAKNLILPVGVTGVTYQGKKVAASRAIWGIYNDDLYEAFVTDRLALDAFFNIWRSYDSLSSMTVEYLDTAINILTTEILSGREYSLAAFILVDSLIKDLQDIIEAKAHSESEDENTLGEHMSDAPDASVMAQTVEELQQKADKLSAIKDQLIEVIKISDASPMREDAIAAFVKNIESLVSSIEKGMLDFSSTKQFSISSFLLLIGNLEELFLRAGPIVMSKKGLADWAKNILKRTLKLVSFCLKNREQLQGANGSAAAFFATYNLMTYIECLVITNPALKDLLTAMKESYAVLKKQYSVWSKVVLVKPAVMAKDFVYAQALALDVYDKKPENYDDPVSVLVSCFPFASAGMKSDAPVYSADAARKLTQKGKGVRIYTDALKESEEDRYSLNIASFLDANPWFRGISEFDVAKFRLAAVSTASTDEVTKKKEEPFNYLGIDERTVDAFAEDLKTNIEVWAKSISFDNKVIGADPTWMTFVSFGVVVSWLKTLATLDDIRMLTRGADFKLKVATYWGDKLLFLEKVAKDSREMSLSDFQEADEMRFVQAISEGCAQYVVQVIKIIAETKIIDVLELERKALASELNKSCSLRSSEDPRLSLDVRRADVEALVGRIEKAISNTDFSYQLSGIATLEALFSNKKAIVADDLVPSDKSGTKVMLIDVLCASDGQNKTHFFQERIHNLLKGIPKKDFEGVHVQVLTAWNSFLDVLFAKQDVPFFLFLKSKTLTTDLGVKDLGKIHGRIKVYLASKEGVRKAKVDLLSMNIRSLEDLKIKTVERTRRFAAIFRDRDLKKKVVDAELVLASQVKNPFVFGFDARFIKSAANKFKVTDDQRDYQVGVYIGTTNSKRKAQLVFDRSTEPLIVLRSMIMLLQSDAFRRGELGYALAEHLLVPIYYMAARFKVDIANTNNLISKMYCAVIGAIQSRLLDRNSILNHAMVVLRMATPAKAADDTVSLKVVDLSSAAKEFDDAFPSYAPILSGPVPVTSPIPVSAAKGPGVDPGLAVAMNDVQGFILS